MKISMRWFGVLLVGVVSQLSMRAATPPAAPAGIDVIWAYAGTWKVETEHFNSSQSKASHEKTMLHNACWKNGAYLACNQYVDGDSKVLIVFTYNAKENVYTSYQIPQGGGESGSGKMVVEGNVWTFPWQVGEGDKVTYYRVVNVFVAPDRIEYRQEFSQDKVHWTVTAKGSESKVSGE